MAPMQSAFVQPQQLAPQLPATTLQQQPPPPPAVPHHPQPPPQPQQRQPPPQPQLDAYQHYAHEYMRQVCVYAPAAQLAYAPAAELAMQHAMQHAPPPPPPPPPPPLPRGRLTPLKGATPLGVLAAPNSPLRHAALRREEHAAAREALQRYRDEARSKQLCPPSAPHAPLGFGGAPRAQSSGVPHTAKLSLLKAKLQPVRTGGTVRVAPHAHALLGLVA